MSESTLVLITVTEIVVLIAGLAFFLIWIGSLLGKIASTLEAGDGLVQKIVEDAKLIGPGLEHINRSGGVVAGALPLLYGFAEQIIGKISPTPERPTVAVPASGRRRSRIHETVGYAPSRH
jgi:delta 1-pyrroline-5-carboxylate dehydrogenase